MYVLINTSYFTWKTFTIYSCQIAIFFCHWGPSIFFQGREVAGLLEVARNKSLIFLAQVLMIKPFPRLFICSPCVLEWILFRLILQVCHKFQKFYIQHSKSNLRGAPITITLVLLLHMLFTNCIRYFNPVFDSFLAISLVLPQTITRAFFIRFSSLILIVEVMGFKSALGLEIPSTLYELPRWFTNFSEQPLSWLSPINMILCFFLLAASGTCLVISIWLFELCMQFSWCMWFTWFCKLAKWLNLLSVTYEDFVE